MKPLKLMMICLLFAQVTVAQVKYTFTKQFVQPGVGDWIQFGKINNLATGTFLNVKIWAHYSNQLFYEEFEFAATTYGNINEDWIEIAPKLTNSFNGIQSFALDAKYKCHSDCTMELRLRRLSGGGSPGTINFVVESNGPFSEANLQGNSGVVSNGYLGNNGGYKFPVSNKTFLTTQEGLFIMPGGNIGIGTINPDSKLAVKGNIRAQGIKVEASPWPDFVFSGSYTLPTLHETEKYIKEKGHLPGIPSAAEVKENGIDLGVMDAKLLQKIEELTLHMIEQNKTITALQIQIKDFAGQLKKKNRLSKPKRQKPIHSTTTH